MNKQRPTELNQKIKRLRASRDGLKLNNREKTLINQKLRDRNVEITESRDHWKTRSKELDRQREALEQQIQVAKEETACERMRADEERNRAEKLQTEIESILKKKSRS
jgi:chromosome segregation ATPase